MPFTKVLSDYAIMASTEREIIVTGNPSWMPPGLRERDRDVVCRWKVTRAERNVFRHKPKIPVSDWAARHRIVTRGPLEESLYRKTTTPYLNGIMDAAWFPSVMTLIVCATPQVGKSFMADTLTGYAIDRDPGPVLYVYPDEDTATENMRDRILPMIKKSPRLRAFLTGLGGDESGQRVNLQHMQVYMAWARSASRLGNRSIKYVILDEVDKYPTVANVREASPIDLAEARTLTYNHAGRKIIKISTPTVEAAPIWQALMTEAQVIFDYWVRCPECRKFQAMRFEQIKVPPDERDPERIQNYNLAWYECESCGEKWNEHMRDVAVRRGQWRSRQEGQALRAYLFQKRPLKIGFHIPSWLSHFVSFGEIGAAFFRAQGSKLKLKDWNNKYCAMPWKPYEVERQEDRILALRDDRPRGIVPSGGVVACLLAGVDTQDEGFWYEIRAFGYGMEGESWQIREGFVLTFDALAEVLWGSEYKDADGKAYFVRFAVQDAMGHRTSEVYDFTRLHRRMIVPFQGKQTLAQPISYTNIDYYPGTKKPIPGGIKLLKADVTFFKNLLANKLEVAPDDPGAWHLHGESTEAWARQMCAEYVDEKGLWQCPEGRDNHGWDCSVYSLVAAEAVGVKFWKKSQGQTKTGEDRAKQDKQTNQQRRRW